MQARLFEPVSVAPLVWFRVLFGGLMAYEALRYVSRGRVDAYFIAPSTHFTYYGFSWIQPWPEPWMSIHFVVMGALALAVAAGAFYRVTAPLFALAFTYSFLLDQARYQNHNYLVCLLAFLLAVAPGERAWSVDAWRRSSLRSPTIPAWSLWMLRAQFAVVYFMGGLAKITPDWLKGEPMRMWLLARMDFPVIGRFFDTAWAPYLFSYGGLVLDLSVPVLLWHRPTRVLGMVIAVVFHLMNSRLFEIGIFPPLALGATLVLFSEDEWLPRPWPALWTSSGSSRPVTSSPRHRRWVTMAIVAWCAYQVVMPLRRFAYPGNPEWTEEGHRFAWRMKLRDKEGRLRLIVRDAVSGQQRIAQLERYYTPAQLEESNDRPDMILQMAHVVAADWHARTGWQVQVFAESTASLNGRPWQTLIDPSVDLAAEPRTLRPASWIVPLTTPLR
jgi:hypothetical protein